MVSTSPATDTVPSDRDREASLKLSGSIERITYANPENGFTVVRLKVKGQRHLVTAVGFIAQAVPGQIVTIVGYWKTDKRYGVQFHFQECHVVLPATTTGIRLYLGSGLVAGLGHKYADRIVNYFGDATLEVLDMHSERLTEVPGIGKKRLKQIITAWQEHQELREVMLFLQSYEVSVAYAVRIFRFYGKKALAVVQTNPYRLALDISGIGFLTADRIAQQLGFARDCDLRVEAGIFYILTTMADKGHVFMPMDKLIAQSDITLGLDLADPVVGEALRIAFSNLELDRLIVTEDLGQPLGTGVYLAPFHVAERGIAARLQLLATAPRTVNPGEVETAIVRFQTEQGLILAYQQAQAIYLAAASKVLVVTGGPGTGKTTILKAVLRTYVSAGVEVMLAAPTGRAAKRMAEATGMEAKTMHRLLEFSPTSGCFERNEDNPLPCGLLVVDEASMLDCIITYHLLKALPVGATMVLVGDVNQLPSIGPGNVLADVIESNTVPVVRLTEIFRQAKESAIIMAAHAINAGRIPYLESSRERFSDCYFIRREDPEEAARLIVELVQQHIPRRFGLDPIADVQVLTPMHRGAVGTESLNARLQEALNPQFSAMTFGGRTFRLGDKVMQIRNNYDKDVFNGDLGQITAVDSEASVLKVCFCGREVGYEATDIDEIMTAYAVSIHKSQGSEYPAVVVPVMLQHRIMLQRNLIYTAVTRGKRLVVLVGTKQALAMAVRNVHSNRRYTWLAHRLVEVCPDI
ncbi:ATP-dependent RecD-like DNA helicase [Desulfovibrionales bacterium]